MPTVLIVEDSLTDTQQLSQYLHLAGLQVISVTNSEDAQRQLQSSKLPPDLILLDIILPGQSGFELCRELKSNPQTRQIPVVMCSTKSTQTDKMWGNLLGANAFLGKPINQQELIQTLQQLLPAYQS